MFRKKYEMDLKCLAQFLGSLELTNITHKYLPLVYLNSRNSSVTCVDNFIFRKFSFV